MQNTEHLTIRWIFSGACLLFALLLCGCENAHTEEASLAENDSNITLAACDTDDSFLNCKYDIVAPKEALFLQLDVAQYGSGDFKQLLKGGISIGEERLPVDQIAGGLHISAAGGQPLSIRIDCSGEAEYTVPSGFFDCPFQSEINEFPEEPVLDDTIRLAKLASTTEDEYIDITIRFGNDMEEFFKLKNS